MTCKSVAMGYAPPIITPEELVQLRQETQVCALCPESLDWSGEKPPCLHHNHETGKVIGFVHPRCNIIEGRGQSEEAFAFREHTYVDPDVSDVLLDGVYINGKLRGQSLK
jgi:hypothetical protein